MDASNRRQRRYVLREESREKEGEVSDVFSNFAFTVKRSARQQWVGFEQVKVLGVRKAGQKRGDILGNRRITDAGVTVEPPCDQFGEEFSQRMVPINEHSGFSSSIFILPDMIIA
jgi:hypothetical protein